VEFALFAVFAFLGQKSRRKQNANKYNTPNQESFMRKILTKIVTLFLITVLSVTAFAGCALITTDTDRDMAQVVATVQIEDDVTADHIHKIEMLSAFMSYGYMYVQQYGYTVEATYEMILKNLVQNKIIIQGARVELANMYNAANANGDQFLAYFIDNATATGNINASAASMGEDYTVEELQRVVSELEKYLTPFEIAQAKHTIRTSINQLVETYAEDDEEEDEKEDETFEARAVPTQKENEAEYEYQLLKSDDGDADLYEYTDYDLEVALAALKGVSGAEEGLKDCEDVWHLNKYVFDNYAIDLSGSNLKAFNVAIEDLKKNGLIAQDEKQDVKTNADNAMNYSYFLASLKNQYESMIVSKYENSLVSGLKGSLSNDKIWEQYQAELKAQTENYLNGVTSYESALESVTEETFVLCNPYEGYGYVANLLIGFSDEQAAALSAEQSKAGATAATIEAKRTQLLGQLQVKDQRESWVYSSYGEYANGEFSFDKKYFVSESSYDKLGKFLGEVFVYDEEGSVGENEDGVEETTWRFSNVIPTSISFDSFINDYVNALLGTSLTAVNGSKGTFDLTDDKRDMLDDLIYAFSTDPGSLGSYLGYAYSPFTSATTYVPEFAEAAKNVVAGGVGSYELVATDFGYHLIICTKKVTKGENEYATKDDFVAAFSDEESLAYKYAELKKDSFVSTEISKVADKLINEKYEEEGVVTYNKKAYKDLIPETEESEDEHAGHNHNH